VLFNFFSPKHHFSPYIPYLQNNEELLSTTKSFDDILLNFALVITANRSPPHNMLLKAFPCGWKSFRSLPTFYSEAFDDNSYILTEDLQLHPLSQAVLRIRKSPLIITTSAIGDNPIPPNIMTPIFCFFHQHEEYPVGSATSSDSGLGESIPRPEG
jgi:hypothetical protein